MRTLLVLTAAAALAAGCATYPQHLEAQFGATTLNARAMQTVDPAAAAQKRPSTMDTVVLVSAVENYFKSFHNPPPPVNVFNIGLGSGAGSSAQ